MGEQYQKTHSCRSGWRVMADPAAAAAPAPPAAAAPAGAPFAPPAGFAAAAAEPIGPLSAAPLFADFTAKSKGFPGGLGVLPDPKLAIAPVPSPMALVAPGLARPPGEEALKGLDFPCDELSPPCRLEKEALRVVVGSVGAAEPVPAVERESLPELRWAYE